MTGRDVLRELESRGVRLSADGETLRYRAPAGVMTDALKAEVTAHKRELLQALAAPAAVRLVHTVAGNVWLVADGQALAENADILSGGLPVFFSDELTALAGYSADEIRTVAAVKRRFPGARIIQDAAAGTVNQRCAA